ncbi:TonB-dependent receptor plug domain-containing protein [Rhodobacteraceae bacterium R_SAG4]|nr:TonB-dependent receptor plug domain-containing protein [Rhodobacteraceae bacterium R_SAG4]
MMKRMTRTSLGALMLTVVIPSAALSQNVTELEEINVVAEEADGVVQGYIATNTLSGSKTGTALVRLDQTVNVVPADQIEDQGAQSVAEALRYTPGVFTEYRGTSNLHDETYIRGFGYAPRFVDGLAFGRNSFGQMAPWLLERVEVIKGPASVLYGQANPGGIINLATKRPTGDSVRRGR